MMDAIAFAQRAGQIAQSMKTVYMKGVFGAPVSEKLLKSKQKQYPTWYTEAKMTVFREKIDTETFGFDCVCFIKAILWGFTGDLGEEWGGAEYQKDGIPDFSVEGMQKYLTEVSDDFDHIAVGEVVFLPGHCGIYIGNGLCAEATTAFGGGVLLSALNGRDGYPKRRWEGHGKLEFVTYPAPELVTLAPWDTGEAVRAMQALLNLRMKTKLTLDASFGPATQAALKNYLKKEQIAGETLVTPSVWQRLIEG